MNDALGQPQSVLVLGGGSEIARATVKALVARRARTVVLAGREPERLAAAAEEARDAGAGEVEVLRWDATDSAGHGRFLASVFERHGRIDLVLVAVGSLGDQQRDEHDPVRAAAVLQANFTGPAAACLAVADCFRAQGQGTLVVLSSVAGVRVRRANFVYGSAKAGLDGFCQGLSDALVGSGARVLIVRPGFVHTKMTAGMSAAPLATTPEAVAQAVLEGLERKSSVVWVPRSLQPAFLLLRALPRALFRRLPG
ncbi:MAG: SDR family NAD(P)-dependent oxidoreductase [Acidimicrobiales bacterium]